MRLLSCIKAYKRPDLKKATLAEQCICSDNFRNCLSNDHEYKSQTGDCTVPASRLAQAKDQAIVVKVGAGLW